MTGPEGYKPTATAWEVASLPDCTAFSTISVPSGNPDLIRALRSYLLSGEHAPTRLERARCGDDTVFIAYWMEPDFQ